MHRLVPFCAIGIARRLRGLRQSLPSGPISGGGSRQFGTCSFAFAVDRDRATCSGGAGAAELASHFVREQVGDQPVEKAAKIPQLDRVRSLNDLQPSGDPFANASNRTVRRALLFMRSVIEDDIDVEQIAKRLNVSRRQLERLFAEDIQISPKAALHWCRRRTAQDHKSPGLGDWPQMRLRDSPSISPGCSPLTMV